MTIDEAIEHAKEVARTCNDSQCTADHMQLAEWLRQARGADKAQRWYTAKLGEARLDVSNLMTENAKLRELCRDMMWTIRHAHGYFKNDTHEMLMTDVRGHDGKPTHVTHSLTCDEKEYEGRMEELGIEVPE